jgi:hypothetical protein
MPTKYLRLGYTESDLLFTYYIVYISSKKIDIMEDEYLKSNTETMLTWFYSTSGYYDKSISHINIDCFFSSNFINYIKKIEETIKESTKCFLLFHDYLKDYYYYFGEFVEYMKDKVFCEIWYNDFNKFRMDIEKYCNVNNFIENKRVLIINPVSELMYQQYKTGNVYKANIEIKDNNEKFPMVKNIIFYKNTYTFFNDGPNKNISETYYYLCKEISNIQEEYDCALISCGAYSCLIASFISNKLNKDVFVIGGTLNDIFALKTQRHKEHQPKFIYNEYWVEIPDTLKPPDYKKIENGCYW